MNFPSSRPTKIIHDLIKLDFMKRVKRGRYKVVKPEDFVKKIDSDLTKLQKNVEKKTNEILNIVNRKI